MTHSHLIFLGAIALFFARPTVVWSQQASPMPTASAATAIELKHIRVDRALREVRIDCQSLAVESPLEFFCVVRNGPEHEAALRTDAMPSEIHAALLMLGLEPGSPVKFSEAKKQWIAPFGPPMRIEAEWKNDAGAVVRVPAEKFMRSLRDKKPMPDTQWIFAGSEQRGDGLYLADTTGYVVSLVNFEMTLIDVSKLVSSANESLEWQYNPEVAPPAGTAVTMILTPIGQADASPATPPATTVASPGDPEADVDEREIQILRDRWRAQVRPHAKAMSEAAAAHFKAIGELRDRQQKLIDEADRLQRLIDELEKAYHEMATPKPG